MARQRYRSGALRALLSRGGAFVEVDSPYVLLHRPGGGPLKSSGPQKGVNATGWLYPLAMRTQRLYGFLGGVAVALVGCPAGGGALVDGVRIEPAAPTSADPLTVVTLDADGQPITATGVTITWRVDGVAAGAVTPVLAAAATTRDQVWDVVVQVGDATLTSDPVTIANSPPSISEVQLTPAEPGSDETIEVLVAGWADADGDAEDLDYQWMVNGDALSVVGGQLGPGSAIRGDEVSVTVTPLDPFGQGTPVTSSVLVVGNGAPYAPSVSVTPSEPSDLDDLICEVDTSDIADPDGDGVTYTVSWAVDGVAFPDPANPGGPEPITTTLNGDTVPAAETQIGDNWQCRVVANDGTEDGAPGTASAYLAAGPVADFSLEDVNATSSTVGQAVSPRDYLQKVSGWYFGHAT